MSTICRFVVLLCFFTTATAQINPPNTKIKYVVSGDTLTHTHYRNVSPDSTSEHIKYAIISRHGDGRNSYEHLSVVTQLTTSVGFQDLITIFAPTCPIQDDINQYNLNDEVLCWPGGDWNAGNLSRNTQSNPRPFRASYFLTVDTIYHRLAENKPSLKKIVLTGHSAGSQMVVRYSAGGRSGKDKVRTVVNQPLISNNWGDPEGGYSEVVLFGGSESTDENGEIFSFLWEQLGVGL